MKEIAAVVFLCVVVMVGYTRAKRELMTDIEAVIVNPAYQGQGIGKLLVEHVINYIRQNAADTKVVCSLYANQGKEIFYQPLGFEKLPNQKYGYGMALDVGTSVYD